MKRTCLLAGILFACACAAFLPSAAYAQAVTSSGPITVSQARALPHNSWVVLSGNIVNALPGGRNYTFRDAAGETITVEIGLKIWRGLSSGPMDAVEIGGELRISRGIATIKVYVITGSGRQNARPGQAVTVNRPIAISEARNLPRDSWVVLAGNIVASLGGDKYSFRDLAGETIVVEIERKIWRGLYAGPSDVVEIGGEVEISKGQFSIEVEVIRMSGAR